MSRHEFLYEITFWEARRIVRGYRRRNRLIHQLIAENVFASVHVMRDAKGMSVEDMFPMLFEDDDYEMEPPITEDEQRELQEQMAAINAHLAEEQEGKSDSQV